MIVQAIMESHAPEGCWQQIKGCREAPAHSGDLKGS